MKTEVPSKSNSRTTTAKSPLMASALAGLVRYAVWAVVAIALLIAVKFSWTSLEHAFFSQNPHFTLKHVEITVLHGQMRPTEILERLKAMKVVVDKSNLFELDLRKLRQELSARCVRINSANLRLKLPDTLIVEVNERTAVAQLPGNRLLDADGWILPATSELKPTSYPTILNIRELKSMRTGVKLTDNLVTAALNLVHLMSVRPYGRLFDISAILLDYDQNVLRLHLRGRGIFSDGAQILLPSKPAALEDALLRIEAIVRERAKSQATTKFIDGTYEYNVPVTP